MFKVGDKVIPSFKVGDRVKFKKSSLDSGMIDATEDDVFVVNGVMVENHKTCIQTTHERGEWYTVNHFEHVKEEVMNNTEEQEIKWEVGQEVFCILRGKGVVTEVLSCTDYPVEVKFADTFDRYTLGGKIYTDHKGRVLFFSEPKIEAEKFPPKKPFVPVFEEGDKIIVVYNGDGGKNFITVMGELKDRVFANDGHTYLKDSYRFYKLGEEIKFS